MFGPESGISLDLDLDLDFGLRPGLDFNHT